MTEYHDLDWPDQPKQDIDKAEDKAEDKQQKEKD